jgi:hypothetical protein
VPGQIRKQEGAGPGRLGVAHHTRGRVAQESKRGPG